MIKASVLVHAEDARLLHETRDVLPRAVARSLPARGHVPEGMAARTTAMTPREGGCVLRADRTADKSR